MTKVITCTCVHPYQDKVYGVQRRVANETDKSNQRPLYRGEEHKGTVISFVNAKKDFDTIPENQQDNFVWSKFAGQSIEELTAALDKL